MNVLDQIVLHKQKEITRNKAQTSVAELQKALFFERKCASLKNLLQFGDSSGIIAEFKTKSPSKGMIKAIPEGQLRADFVSQITKGYQKAGATAISVLTDQAYFAGEYQDLQEARNAVQVPLLRKDFMLDEYQIIEAKAWGADLILLIAACLEPDTLKYLAQFAHSLGLEVLMEVHDEAELQAYLNEHIDLVGVNNRNLKTFEVSIDTSLRLAELIPHQFVKISESGISQVDTILELRAAGYQGFLMGENFMKAENPAQACTTFMQELQTAQLSKI